MQNGICMHVTCPMRIFFLLRFLLDLKSHAVLEQYIESVRYPEGENSRWEELLNEL